MYTTVNAPALFIVMVFLLFLAGWMGYRFGWGMRSEQYAIDEINKHVERALQAQESLELCTCDTCTSYEAQLQKDLDAAFPPKKPELDW